jgi:long-chain acyl-CoA synthetase
LEQHDETERTAHSENHAESVSSTPQSAEAGTPSADLPEKPWLKHYPAEVSPSLDYPDINVTQFLLDAAEAYPDKIAIHFMGKNVTYRKLKEDALSLAAGLVRLGIGKGDRVAIMLPNCPQAVTAFYGVLLAGAVVVQTNPLYVERELQEQLKDSGARAIITLDLLYPRLSRARGQQPLEGPLSELLHVIVTSIKDGLPFPLNLLYPIKQRKEGIRLKVPYGTEGVRSYRELISSGRRLELEQLPELGTGDELAALQYTGGTTGTPKGVMLTHANMVANTLQISAWCYKQTPGEEIYLAALPLFHVFGLTVLMNMSVRSGGKMVLLPRFEPDKVLEAIQKQRPTIFPGAPTMYVALINRKDADQFDLSSINVCISGSAALPLEIQDSFELLTGGRLIEGYGLTEASPVTHANPIWGRRKIGTIGLPLPDTEAAIMNPVTGERLPPGQLGELVIKGPQVMKGYWGRPAESEGVFSDGWLRTGDYASMDEEGYFAIKDRLKDVIIAGGYNIYPREVEEVLFEHPAVKEAAVAGMKDQYRGESVKAFIVLKDGWQVSPSQLDRWCRDRLAAYKVPHRYIFKESLPKTMIGKVLRRKLSEDEENE